MPEKLSTPEEKSRYESFIMAITQIENGETIRDELRGSKLAPDRAGVLRTAAELFDHKSIIFSSVFRTAPNEKSRFLLEETEKYTWFWLQIGLLKDNQEVLPIVYILCLRALRKRLEACKDFSKDLQIISDADAVLKPITAKSASCAFSAVIWRSIAREAMFPAIPTDFSKPSYRQETMALVYTAMPLLLLSEVYAHQHIPVCWSQTSFAKYEPTVRSFDSLSSQGKPPTAMVWRHLDHLASLAAGLAEAHFSDFLADVSFTYRYLQDNLHESSVSFALRTKKIWLNLDSYDPTVILRMDLQSSWYNVDHLVLASACDIGNVMSVRDGLMPYERLLKSLGCEPIVYPTVPAADGCPMESVSSAMQRMTCEGKLLDVTLVAEDKPTQAHKLILAASSSYFTAQFNGSWYNNETITLDDITYPFLSIIVNFAYADADKFDWTNLRHRQGDSDDAIADKLDIFLDLLTGADRFDMPALMAQVENKILEDGRYSSGLTMSRTCLPVLRKPMLAELDSCVPSSMREICRKWTRYTRRDCKVRICCITAHLRQWGVPSATFLTSSSHRSLEEVNTEMERQDMISLYKDVLHYDRGISPFRDFPDSGIGYERHQLRYPMTH